MSSSIPSKFAQLSIDKHNKGRLKVSSSPTKKYFRKTTDIHSNISKTIFYKEGIIDKFGSGYLTNSILSITERLELRNIFRKQFLRET